MWSQIRVLHVSKHIVPACRCHMHMLAADVAQIDLEGNDQGLAAGQYVCLYQDGFCLGSAVIKSPS